MGGSFLYKICASECKTECEAAAKAARGGAPSVPAHLKCLAASCFDMSPEVIKNLTGSSWDCTALMQKFGGDCSTDLSAAIPRLPAGTTLTTICQAQCGCKYMYQEKEKAVSVATWDGTFKKTA